MAAGNGGILRGTTSCGGTTSRGGHRARRFRVTGSVMLEKPCVTAGVRCRVKSTCSSHGGVLEIRLAACNPPPFARRPPDPFYRKLLPDSPCKPGPFESFSSPIWWVVGCCRLRTITREGILLAARPKRLRRNRSGPAVVPVMKAKNRSLRCPGIARLRPSFRPVTGPDKAIVAVCVRCALPVRCRRSLTR